MFGVMAGLIVALVFAIGGTRVALDIRGAATAMARRREENVDLQRQAQGMLGAAPVVWPVAVFRCVGAAVGLAGLAGVLLAVMFLVTVIA
ncbi:hypothetical protein [Streptomyces sp. BE230]|uniref:hypothetical protein n=1 Tax=Streptomyces sp. BE230 TaxID=3002526 RepID=UPI002ED021BF|nr:hypothetical protein [Streptomyces sp. BE230]